MAERSMRTNADCTIFNKYIVDREEVWQSKQIHGVAWENRKGSNVLRSGGQLAADQARIFIPMSQGADYLKPREWQALANKEGNKWTLQVGDVIVKGLVDEDIDAGFTLSDLKRTYDDALVISSVDTMDAGSASMWHWQIGAK
jgi:hypothetical protein